MPHVDDGTLHALLDGALRAEEPERADEVETHLETCADCRARLQQAGELRGLASDIMASLDAEADLPVSPDFGDVVARASGRSVSDSTTPGSNEDRVRRQYRWTGGLAWAATIVVALGTGYLARDLTGPEAQRSRQERMTRQVPVPAAPADAAESEAIGPGDAAVQEDAAPKVTEAEPAGGQLPAQTPERRAVAAPAERESNTDLDARQQALGGQPPDQGEEAILGYTTLELADEIVAPTAWVEAELTDVERRVGTILVLPGAEIARAELLPGTDTVARTLQVLPDDIEVQVIQTRAAVVERLEGEPADADAAPTPAVAAEVDRFAAAPAAVDASARLMAARARSDSTLDSVASEAAGEHIVHEASVVRDGVRLTLVGPLPRGELEQLAAAAVPRQR